MAAVMAWLRPQLRRQRRPMLALAALVGISTAVVLTAAAGARRTDTAFDRLLTASAAADARVQYTTSADIDAEVLARFRAHPDVEQVVPVHFIVAFTEASEYDIGLVHSPDDAFLHDIDRLRLLAGRLPSPDAPGEIVANEFMAEDLDLDVGDAVSLTTFSQAQLDQLAFDEEAGGPVLDLTVVGIGRAPDDVAEQESAILFAGAGFDQVRGDAGGFGPSLELLLRDDADPASVVAAAMDGIPVDEATEVESTEARSARVRDATQVLAMGLAAFAACAGLAAIVACGQAIARMLSVFAVDQVSLQAMGFTRGQRLAAVVVATAPVAVGGAAVGILLAIAASPLMPIGIARRAEPSPGIDVDLPVLGLVTVATLVVLMAAATASAWRMTRPTPSASAAVPDNLRGRRSAGAATAARAGWSPSAVLGIAMALEPGRGRTAVPVRSALVGAVAGVAGVVAALTFGASLDHLVSTPAAYGWNWAVRPDLFEEQAQAVAELPEVRDLGVLAFRQTSVDGQQVDGVAMVALEGRPSLTVLDGRMPGAAGEVALGPKTADALGKGIGDPITVEAPDGDVEVRVVGEVLFPVFDENAFNEGVAFHADLLGDVELSDGFGATIVDFADGVSDEEGIEAVRAAAPESLSIYSYPSQPGDVANLAQVSSMPFALAAFLVVVALGAVSHALVTSVRRRRRDLGVVRAIGFLRREVVASVAIQSSTLVAVGLVVGVPLGVALGRTVWSLVADGLGVAPSPMVPVAAMAVVVVGALVAAATIALWPAHRAAATVPADSLRAE